MPIIQTETGYIYKKNVKSRRIPPSIKAFFIFVIIICLIVGILYSTTFFNITSIFGLSKYKIFDKKIYYAVSIGSGDSFSEVSKLSVEIKQKNGSGYVYNINNKYYVVANLYSSKKDALKVCENLQDYNADILNLELNMMIVSQEYTSEQIKNIKNGLNLVNNTFDKLYGISLSLDRGEILQAEAKQKLQVFKETCQRDREMFNNAFKDNCDNLITNVKIFQSEVISNIGALMLSDKINSDIKYTNALIIDMFAKILKNIEK